eukprot:752037-Pyramimonas_sp.AAC.1
MTTTTTKTTTTMTTTTTTPPPGLGQVGGPEAGVVGQVRGRLQDRGRGPNGQERHVGGPRGGGPQGVYLDHREPDGGPDVRQLQRGRGYHEGRHEQAPPRGPQHVGTQDLPVQVDIQEGSGD